MYAVVRTYSGAGAKKLFDVLEKRSADVEALIRGGPGLKSYTLLRGGDGGVSVTVCQDKAGADESLKMRAIGSRKMPLIPVWARPPSRKERSSFRFDSAGN